MENTDGDDAGPVIAEENKHERADTLADVLAIVKPPLSKKQLYEIGGNPRAVEAACSVARKEAAQTLIYGLLAPMVAGADKSKWGVLVRKAVVEHKTGYTKSILVRAAAHLINQAGPLVRSATLALFACAVLMTKDMNEKNPDLSSFAPSVAEATTTNKIFLRSVYAVLSSPPGEATIAGAVDK
jgi:hypothetical protein